eukprot:TRINITY_DN3966_c0_g1_i2.p1 TRINITY_DN3966_c0_g1~~TRINITY_DN3966_c0_g1_i2.p1  ORF type:complete len:303 (-),score=41.92 TRINITY_DN3966_c0_g1_i2:153-1061(-)
METIRKLDPSVVDTLTPSIHAFLPLLEKNRATIESIRRDTFQFGVTQRQMLDVYYPPSVGDSKPPILIFVYGGGMVWGERVLPPPNDLVYRNCGAFFAARGILTIIPDYRLAPGAVYPEPVEDIRDAFRFVVSHPGLSAVGDTSRVYFTGHSAGGTLVLSLFLSESPRFLEPHEIKAHVRGIIPRGAGYHYEDWPTAFTTMLTPFYGDAEKSLKASPLGLLRSASQDLMAALPPLLFMHSEIDTVHVLEPQKAFIAEYEERTGKQAEVVVCAGHNHMSEHWALNSGEGEEWGDDLARWIKSK